MELNLIGRPSIESQASLTKVVDVTEYAMISRKLLDKVKLTSIPDISRGYSNSGVVCLLLDI